MAEIINIRLEQPVPGVDLSAEFAAFGKNWDAIEAAAQELDILSPFDFVSETPAEYAEMMKDVKEVEKELGDFNMDDIKDNPEFKQLLADLGNNPDVMKMMKESNSPDEMLSQVFPDESPGEEWYDAEEGVEFCRQLENYAKEHPKKFKAAEVLREELQKMTHILQAAQKSGTGFYFALQG